jgi:hypothetical protein
LIVKELQTFESKTILCLLNIFTIAPILNESCEILFKAQAMAQEDESIDFVFDLIDLPPKSSLPAIELCLQVSKLPGQDTSYFDKLSWKAQTNRKVFHVKCDSCSEADIKRLTQIAKDANIVMDM